MGYAVLRFEKVKSREEIIRRSRHNRRALAKELDHVDVDRVKDNVVLGNAVQEYDKITKGVAMRKNGVVAVEGVLSYSPGTKVDVNKWSSASIEWLERQFGKDNILEVSLHKDEKTPHLHVIFAPRVNGRWNWRGMCPGRKGMVALQDSYAEAMAPFGLQRGNPKSGRKHIPPATYREMEALRSSLSAATREKEELKNSLVQKEKEAKKVAMDKETSVLDIFKAYLGEERFLSFLKWAKSRSKNNKQAQKLSSEVLKRYTGDDASGDGTGEMV